MHKSNLVSCSAIVPNTESPCPSCEKERAEAQSRLEGTFPYVKAMQVKEEALKTAAARIPPDDSTGGKLRAIVLYPDAHLRARSDEVIEHESTDQLVRDLIATAKVTKAAGLSAPQIGVNKRVIVVEVNGEGSGEFRALINPVIHGTEGDLEMVNEGCLSFPRFQAQVGRRMKVYGEALTSQGLKWFFFIEGAPAQAVQHEVEHLDGKLLIDNLGPTKHHQLQTKMKQLNRRLGSIIRQQGRKAQPASSYVFGYVVDPVQETPTSSDEG